MKEKSNECNAKVRGPLRTTWPPAWLAEGETAAPEHSRPQSAPEPSGIKGDKLRRPPKGTDGPNLDTEDLAELEAEHEAIVWEGCQRYLEAGNQPQ
jgi:hypothetical protein